MCTISNQRLNWTYWPISFKKTVRSRMDLGHQWTWHQYWKLIVLPVARKWLFSHHIAWQIHTAFYRFLWQCLSNLDDNIIRLLIFVRVDFLLMGICIFSPVSVKWSWRLSVKQIDMNHENKSAYIILGLCCWIHGYNTDICICQWILRDTATKRCLCAIFCQLKSNWSKAVTLITKLHGYENGRRSGHKQDNSD